MGSLTFGDVSSGFKSQSEQPYSYLVELLHVLDIHFWCDTYQPRDRKLNAYTYRLGTVNSNTVNSKFHLIQSFCELSVRCLPIISSLKCTVNSNFHFIRIKTLPMNGFELTVPDLYLQPGSGEAQTGDLSHHRRKL